MTWDAEQWRRRFDNGATQARSYVRENRTRIAKNDQRIEAAKWAVDNETAKADLYDILAGAAGSQERLHQQATSLNQNGPSRIPSNTYEGKRYREAWRRECEAILREIATPLE